MRVAILALCIVLLAGCSTTNISELIQALASDPATVCITATGYGGSVTVSRTNIANGDVTCPPGGGLSVKSQGGTNIPVTVMATQPPVVTVVPQTPK